jgi:diaminopimelate decarboxylase
LLGVSVEVVRQDNDDDDYLDTIRHALKRIALDGMHLDVTGAVTPNMAPFFSELQKSFSRISVDASDLLVAQAGALCTRIIGVKEVDNVRHLYIDDGCYGSLCQDFRTTDKKEHVPLPLLKNSAETQVTTVWGPTCDGLDRVCQNVILPRMHVDEWLVFFNMGQSSGMGTAFNGFDPPDVVHYCVLGHSRQF